MRNPSKYVSGVFVRVTVQDWTLEDLTDAWQDADLGDEPPAWLLEYPEAIDGLVSDPADTSTRRHRAA